MPSVNLTDAAVKRYKSPKAGQVDYYDKSRPGLALRVSHKGRKSWTMYYRLKGKQHRRQLGIYPAMTLADARIAWAAIRDLIAAGTDPAKAEAEAEKQTDTFKAVAEEWLRRDQSKNKTIYDVRRAIERDVLPFWGELRTPAQ